MGRNILHRLALVVTVVAALFLSGCGGDSQKQERLHREAEDIVSEAYEVRDYQRIIEIVDSLKQLGSMSEGKAYYWLGYAYDRLMQKRMAELYWKKGIAAIENSTEVEDVKVYAPIGLWPDLEYVGEEMDLPSGSTMLLYTDGLNEAENRQQEQYGEDRIIQLMASHASQSMREMVEALKADADQFRDGAEQNDDLTMLALSVV